MVHHHQQGGDQRSRPAQVGHAGQEKASEVELFDEGTYQGPVDQHQDLQTHAYAPGVKIRRQPRKTAAIPIHVPKCPYDFAAIQFLPKAARFIGFSLNFIKLNYLIYKTIEVKIKPLRDFFIR